MASHENMCRAIDTERDDLPGQVQLYQHVNELYEQRVRLVALIMRLCQKLSYPAGLVTRLESTPGWEHLAVFDLPSGQCSFPVHSSELSLFAGFPAYSRAWDGHSPEDCWQRIMNPHLEPWFMRPWATKVSSDFGNTFATVPAAERIGCL